MERRPGGGGRDGERAGWRRVWLTLDRRGKAIGAGDWLAVEKEFPGDPAAGWWPTLKGGARLEAERADLSPDDAGTAGAAH